MTTKTEKPDGLGDMIACGCGCGQTFREFDKDGRQRKYVNGHNVRDLWRRLKSLGALPAQP